jgi:hypothetical protein
MANKWKRPDPFDLALWAALTALVLAVVIILGRTPLALINTAHADTGELTWTAPTHNCDGSSLTNLSGYKVYWGTGSAVLPATALAYTVPSLPPGVWWFSIAALAGTTESQFVTVTKTVLPANFKSLDTIAYTVVKRPNSFLLLPVGTIPVGTVCDATQEVNGRYVVPRESVTWSGSIKPDVVVATCG